MSLFRKHARIWSVITLFSLAGGQVLQAAGPADARKTPVVADVALHNGGTLVGQVLNSSSVAQTGKTVAISQNGKLVASAKTDAKGRFVIQGLRAGTYVIETQASNGLVRLWAPRTAPPAAKSAVVMVSQDNVVRGQLGGGVGFNVDTAIFLGVAGAGLGIGIYQVTKDDGGGATGPAS